MYLGKDNPNFENRGEKNPLFKGGRRINSRGYVLVYHPEHPNCDQDGYVMEHRYIMSLHLGRPLEAWEVVHHKDHNKQNNKISNLEVMSLADHTRLHNEEKEIIRCEKTGRILVINVIAPVITAHFEEVDELSNSERGVGGFGSTGIK
ncbi:HNH endonuclease [Bacillus paranthracis]|uniref:HNH endonuclease n=2 Tax=Bacillus TaxID=1386 RepID=UPI002FDC1242